MTRRDKALGARTAAQQARTFLYDFAHTDAPAAVVTKAPVEGWEFTTDDPELLTWIVDHQKGIDPMAYRLFYKYYKKLEEKNRAGLLEGFKKRNRQFKRDHRSP